MITINTKTIKTARNSLKMAKDRSAWSRGVNMYALELLDSLEERIESGDNTPENCRGFRELEYILLNGAENWGHYSYGGCSLIYSGDIAERLCCPSELKKTDSGRRDPNSRETWCDVQARALFQACNRIYNAL